MFYLRDDTVCKYSKYRLLESTIRDTQMFYQTVMQVTGE